MFIGGTILKGVKLRQELDAFFSSLHHKHLASTELRFSDLNSRFLIPLRSKASESFYPVTYHFPYRIMHLQ